MTFRPLLTGAAHAALLATLAATFLLISTPAGAQNSQAAGWSVDILADTFGYGQQDLLIPQPLVYQGCPARDCIPSIDEPEFIPASEAGGLADDDLLLAIAHNGVTKGYPIRYLDRHEIVNDDFAGEPVVVTYCPLCGSGLAFLRTVQGEVTEFGVSGLLFNNDLIFYDRATNSLWQQIIGRSIAGPRKGHKLEDIPLTMTTLAAYRAQDANALLLDPPRPAADYERQVYGDYADSDRLLFPVTRRDARLHPKRIVYGLRFEDQAVAVDHEWLVKQGEWQEKIAGSDVQLTVEDDGAVRATRNGEPMSLHRMYWFAWYTFHPRTALIDGRQEYLGSE